MVWKGQKFDESPPEDFDPAKPYADPVAMIEQREYIVREKLIAIEMSKVLRERVQQCYRREGVNHYQKCREHVRNYLKSINDVGWGKDARRPITAIIKEELTSLIRQQDD
ncbi:hypothetical protein R1sor_006578 [Riccia sorocarpa]|uniref:NADH-ubiquinone oxidoreductase 12 kDa subunit n=1 Tax=Riccia sorocarpa TaxID=122646 RepID=A0ABD3HN16_9MARC